MEQLMRRGAQNLDVAYRQAMLGDAVGNGSSHPTRTWLLYDEVRSSAVHSRGPEVTTDERRKSEATVYRPLDQYLRLAASHSFSLRGRLVQYLDTHENRLLLLQWLRDNAGPSVGSVPRRGVGAVGSAQLGPLFGLTAEPPSLALPL
jgi:hypothetical protein